MGYFNDTVPTDGCLKTSDLLSTKRQWAILVNEPNPVAFGC